MSEFEIVNASKFQPIVLKKNTTMYCKSLATEQIRSNIRSLDDALNLNHWQKYFDPFACIVVDSERQEAILVRDHLGVQPLYYFFSSNQLIFAQTLPDIIRHLPFTPSFNEAQIINLFSDRSIYSDETIYQGIYRVEPGHLMHMKRNKTCVKKTFWQLEPDGDMLHYSSPEDYLAHFTELMHEAVRVMIPAHEKLAAEFSAGMDSSAVCATALDQGLKPMLFMHAATPNTKSALVYNPHYEKIFIDHYQLTDIQYITADEFDPIQVFQRYAKWFAGPAPHIFYMFAHHFHRAIAKTGCKILLSGLGGDQGVSGHAPTRFILPMLIHQKNHREVWEILSNTNQHNSLLLRGIKYAHQYAKYTNPSMHHMMQQLEETWRISKNLFMRKSHRTKTTYPYFTDYFSSLREAEWAFLQGPFSYDIRMRIEYSSVVTQQMGFEYRYPLLYPKLLAFLLKVPYTQKRHLGQGRHLMRAYLKQQLHLNLFNRYQKKEGLYLLPETLDLFQKQFTAGVFQKHFTKLPYSSLIPHENAHVFMINSIHAFMLNHHK